MAHRGEGRRALRRTAARVYQDSRVTPPGLRDLRDHPDRAGVFLDFDGTLSEIAPTPDDARAVDGVAPVLERLASRYRVVATISGRPATEVAALLGAPIRIFGLYGLEDERGSVPDGEGRRAGIERALPAIERAAAYVPGATVERKGLSAAVHYRAASDPELARRVLLERLQGIAREHGLEVIEGKRVIELTAGPRPRKGEVLARVAREERLRHVLYAGDDLADLDAFGALDSLAEEGVGGIRVAVRSAETPEALIERADVVVEGPLALVDLLADLGP
jgi:trehalose 6-phosphate phosphatase